MVAKRKISVIVPVFNEENNILKAYQSISQVFSDMGPKYDFEIIFNDNHSTDRSYSVIKELCKKDSRVKAIRFSRNFGFQRSLLAGYLATTGDAAIPMDCDMQNPPELIPQFIKKWEKGSDVVVGIRKERKESFFLTWCRKIFYKLIRNISDDQLLENASDFRLVDRSVLNKLSNINDIRPYTRGLISALARNQVGLPYRQNKRKHGESKFPFFKLTSMAADGIVGHSLVPLRIAMGLGFFIFMTTMLLCFYYFLAWLMYGKAWPSGFATTTILLLFTIGLNALFVGILGEYVGRIFEQVRWRPNVIIEDSIHCSEEIIEKISGGI